MTRTPTASEQITEEVTSWPGVKAGPGSRGEFAFTIDGHQIGHLHGNRSAHFSFPAKVGLELKARGRVVDHPVFPGNELSYLGGERRLARIRREVSRPLRPSLAQLKAALIAVGTAVAGGPPRRSQRARQRTGLLPWVLASKRTFGQG